MATTSPAPSVFDLTAAGLAGLFGRFFGAVAAAHAVGREFEILSGRTDAQLARDGLSRDTLARTIYDRHFD